MKTIFDGPIRIELINRINMLHENSTAQWGRMTVYQMLKHCKLWEEMILGRQCYKRAFLGRVFGKMALKEILNDENPLRRNTPTIPELKIREREGIFSIEKTQWISLIREHEHFSNPGLVHPFFGKMTSDQVGCLAYKHADHHLRQFNC